jgi:hypothetical protein
LERRILGDGKVGPTGPAADLATDLQAFKNEAEAAATPSKRLDFRKVLFSMNLFFLNLCTGAFGFAQSDWNGPAALYKTQYGGALSDLNAQITGK